MSFNELLVSPFAYAPPAHLLEGLSDAEAVKKLDGTPHTVAEIVAHMAFWQEWFLDRCRGAAAPMAEHAAAGWPGAPAGSWDETRGRFLEGLRQAASMGAHPGGAPPNRSIRSSTATGSARRSPSSLNCAGSSTTTTR